MRQKLIYAFTLSMLTSLVFGQPPGSDRDAHGCIGSAGYTYSILKNSCIRVFEEKIKLNEVDPGGGSYIVAVIFSKDKKKAEIFMAEQKEGLILTRKGKTNKYVLTKEKLELTVSRGYYLRKAGKLVYKLNGLVKP